MMELSLADQFHLNAMRRFIQIMMVLLSDGALPTIKIVQQIVARRVWIKLTVPSQVKRNAIYGCIAHPRQGAFLQTFMNTKMGSAG